MSSKISSLKALNDSGCRLGRLRPPVPPDRTGEGCDGRRETSPGDRHERDLADHLRFGNDASNDARDRRRELRDKADSEPGSDHRLDPVLTLAAEADLERKSLLAAALVQMVLVFAINPGKISLASDTRYANPVLLAKAMAHRERDTEPLVIERANLEPVAESFRLRHHCEIEVAVEEQFGKPPRDAFDERHIAARMRGAELGEEAHKADRSDRTHHAEIDWRVVHMEEVLRCRFGRLGIGHHLLEMRTDQSSEIGQMRQVVLAPQQQTA